MTTDPKSLVLQNADVPSGYLVDSQQSGANPEVFAGIGARRIGALFAGAVPSDSYQQVFRGPVATPFEQLSVISAVAIYRSVGDAASVKPDPRSDLFANEVGQGTPLGDGGHVYASSRSKVLVLVIVYWRDRNVIAYLRWVYASTGPSGVPDDVATSAIANAIALAHRVETHIRIAT